MNFIFALLLCKPKLSNKCKSSSPRGEECALTLKTRRDKVKTGVCWNSEYMNLFHFEQAVSVFRKLLKVFWNPPGESDCAHLAFGLMLRFSWVWGKALPGERIWRMIKNPYNEIIENSAWGEIFQKCKYMKIHNL